jgi:hypothetical protein
MSPSLQSKASNGPFSDENLISYPFMYAPRVRFAAAVECQVQKFLMFAPCALYTHRVSNIRKQSLC